MTTTDHKPLWALGMMSGTSLDGVDVALLRSNGVTIDDFGKTLFEEYPTLLRLQLKDLMEQAANTDFNQASDFFKWTKNFETLEREMTTFQASVAKKLLKEWGKDCDLIGFHGQTLYHRPQSLCLLEQEPLTWQMGDGKLMASLLGRPVVNDFRSFDVMQGGEGAPLVPTFHRALAHKIKHLPCAFINIGGVANVTFCLNRENHNDEARDDGSDLLAFDTGPGNALLNDWMEQKTKRLFDEGGKAASQGCIDEKLLSSWLKHPFFEQKPPKSLDRKTFSFVLDDLKDFTTNDGAATLTAFTTMSIANSVKHCDVLPKLWILCGGGRHNAFMCQLLESHLSRSCGESLQVKLSDDLGVSGDFMESFAFAYLGIRTFYNLPISFSKTTGIKNSCVGGVLN